MAPLTMALLTMALLTVVIFTVAPTLVRCCFTVHRYLDITPPGAAPGARRLLLHSLGGATRQARADLAGTTYYGGT